MSSVIRSVTTAAIILASLAVFVQPQAALAAGAADEQYFDPFLESSTQSDDSQTEESSTEIESVSEDEDSDSTFIWWIVALGVPMLILIAVLIQRIVSNGKKP